MITEKVFTEKHVFAWALSPLQRLALAGAQKKKMTSSAPAAEKHISEIKDALTNANVFF